MGQRWQGNPPQEVIAMQQLLFNAALLVWGIAAMRFLNLVRQIVR